MKKHKQIRKLQRKVRRISDALDDLIVVLSEDLPSFRKIREAWEENGNERTH